MHLELHLRARLTLDMLQGITVKANLAECEPVCQDNEIILDYYYY